MCTMQCNSQLFRSLSLVSKCRVQNTLDTCHIYARSGVSGQWCVTNDVLRNCLPHAADDPGQGPRGEAQHRDGPPG